MTLRGRFILSFRVPSQSRSEEAQGCNGRLDTLVVTEDDPVVVRGAPARDDRRVSHEPRVSERRAASRIAGTRRVRRGGCRHKLTCNGAAAVSQAGRKRARIDKRRLRAIATSRGREAAYEEW